MLILVFYPSFLPLFGSSPTSLFFHSFCLLVLLYKPLFLLSSSFPPRCFSSPAVYFIRSLLPTVPSPFSSLPFFLPCSFSPPLLFSSSSPPTLLCYFIFSSSLLSSSFFLFSSSFSPRPFLSSSHILIFSFFPHLAFFFLVFGVHGILLIFLVYGQGGRRGGQRQEGECLIICQIPSPTWE